LIAHNNLITHNVNINFIMSFYISSTSIIIIQRPKTNKNL